MKPTAHCRGASKRRHRRAQLTCGAASLLACALVVAASTASAAAADKRASRERFTRHTWSQTRPNLHFQYGCDTGWHAFRFRADGYFVFDRTIAGAWWMDHLGNVDVRTNSGERLLLFFDGGAGLSQRQKAADGPKSVFGEEYRIYRECET